MQNFYPYIIAIILLTLFLIYFEIKRTNKKRLIIRILAVTIAAASLLFLIVPVKYSEEIAADLKVINFLTPGVQAEDLTTEIYFTSDSSMLKMLEKSRVTYIPDLLYYLETHPEVTGVKVYGYGLPKAVLNNLEGRTISFHPSALPDGILSCSWPRAIPASEILRVQGTYNNTGNVPVKLSLLGLGTVQDSVMVPAKKQMIFTLSCQPRQTGRAVYQLLTSKDDKKTSSEEIPFEVTELPKPRILVLASFPDFENKFLRNWLFENNYPAFFRTRVSKDKFSTEQINLEGTENTNITASALKKYDLLIADDEELANLGSLSPALHREIRAGLGLLIRLNDAKPLSEFSKAFRISGTADSISTAVVPVLSENTQRLKALPMTQQVYMDGNTGQLSLVKEPKGKVLVSSALNGKGRITATSLSATFNWVLNAANSDYAAYWSQLIKHTSKRFADEFHWTTTPVLPSVSEQVRINFQGPTATALAALTVNDRGLSVQQHLVLPFYWQGAFRADRKGWNDFTTFNIDKQALYIYDTAAWRSLKAAELININTRFQDRHVAASEKEEKSVTELEKHLPKWIFVAFFLLSMAFLWFETKILQ